MSNLLNILLYIIMANYLKKNKLKNKNLKYGGNPIVTIDPLALGNYKELEPSLTSSGLEITAGIANRVINESNFIIKDTATATFETIVTETPTGLVAATSSSVPKIAALSLGFIVAAAIIVAVKFYMVLRNNSYAYRNALVIIYEFYEILFRLYNLIDYIEKVSIKLDPPFVLDSGEIYQDIKNIFQVMDLITTSTMFKSINITSAKGERYYINDNFDDRILMPDDPSWTAKLKSKIKSWTFDEPSWNNKMNLAMGRLNTHMILLITEWKIISDLRSTNLSREILEERKTLLPIKCMIRRIILAPLIRIRTIMYACALSSQTDLCLNNANSDRSITFKMDKFKENMKRLWNKINDGGTADFKKILMYLNREIDNIKSNPDYNRDNYYIEQAFKEFIEELNKKILDIIGKNEDITLPDYQIIYESVEVIYNYAQNCNLTELLNDTIKDIATHRRYKAAAESSVQKRIIIGVNEQEQATSIINRWNFFYLLLLQKFNVFDDMMINLGSLQLKGFILFKIPYNSYFIIYKPNQYESILKTIIRELENIYNLLHNLNEDIKDDNSIIPDIRHNVMTELQYSLSRYTMFNNYLSQCNILNQNIIDITALINRHKSDVLKTEQFQLEKTKKIKEFEDLKTEIGSKINDLKNDFNVTNYIIQNLSTIRLKKKIDTSNNYWYFEDIGKYILLMKSIIQEGSNTLYTIDFIEKINKLLIVFTFLMSELGKLESINDDILSKYKSFEKGTMVAELLLIVFFINNHIIYFRTDEYYEQINEKLLFFFRYIVNQYGHINFLSFQNQRREYINYNKGFLCLIHEFRLFEKIKKINDYNHLCSTIKFDQYTIFNNHLSHSQFGGRYKSKKKTCKKINKKSRRIIIS